MRGSPGTGAAEPWAAPSVAPVTACPLGRTYSGPVMCRLFALRSDQPVTADLWLLDAPYSLLHQSRFNADGTGLGWIDERGQARVRTRPVAALGPEEVSQGAATMRARSLWSRMLLTT